MLTFTIRGKKKGFRKFELVKLHVGNVDKDKIWYYDLHNIVFHDGWVYIRLKDFEFHVFRAEESMSEKRMMVLVEVNALRLSAVKTRPRSAPPYTRYILR